MAFAIDEAMCRDVEEKAWRRRSGARDQDVEE